MEILIGVLIFVVVVLGYIFHMYNRLTQLRNALETEWSLIDVQLKKRSELIPNIIETVKGYAKHEREVLEGASKARSEILAAKKKGQNENEVSRHVKSVLALREAYPDLKASEDFRLLQAELFEVEDEIAEYRHNFNDIVKAYNDYFLGFPGNIIAGMLGFEFEEDFEFLGSREVPKLGLTDGEDLVV